MSEINAYKKMYRQQQPVKLTETTVPERLKYIPESWEHHSRVDSNTKEKMRNALNGSTFIHFPLDNHVDVDPEVHEHLTNHGYSIEDYKAGIASKTVQVGNPERGIPHRLKKITKRIGAIIDETGAPDYVKKAYENDPARTASKHHDLHVVISTSPLAIAGMTTGTAWHNSSCMELEGGIHKKFLKSDSELGTHIAFLVHKDDKDAFEHGEPSNPIARIAIKPFHADDDNHHLTEDQSKDVIFRPERRAYGASNSLFSSAVANWAHTNYPAKEGVAYKKHDDVYDDDDQSRYQEISSDKLHEMLKSGGKYMPMNVYLPRHKIETAMNGLAKGDYSVGRVTRIANISPLDVKAIYKLHPDDDTLDTLATRHGDKFSEHMIRQYISKISLKKRTSDHTQISNSLPNNILANTKLPQEVVDSIHPMKYPFVRRNKLKIQHFENAMLNDDAAGIEATQHLAQERHLARLTRMGVLSEDALTKHPKFTQAVHDELVADGYTRHIGTSRFASLSDIRSGDDIIRLAKNPHFDHSQSHLKDLFMSHVKQHVPNDLYGSTLNGVIGYQSSNIVPANISRHMTDEDFDHFPEKNISTAFADKEDNKRYINRIMHTAIHSPDGHKRINHAAEDLQFFADEHGPLNVDKETAKFIHDHAVNLWPKLKSVHLQDQTMGMITKYQKVKQ